MYLIDQGIEKKSFDDEELSIIKGNGSILLSLINDILDYCQFKRSVMKYIIEPFNVNEMANEIYQTMNIQAKLKNIKLLYDYQLPIELEINSDRRRILQVLMNLISNALKFTTKNGKVLIRVFQRLENSHLIFIEVSDTGSGMKQETIKKLGEEYQTFGQTSNKNSEGIGLGLYLSQQIIQELGPQEKFSIKSQIGKGTSFKFSVLKNYYEKNSSFISVNSASQDSDSSCLSFELTTKQEVYQFIHQQVEFSQNHQFAENSKQQSSYHSKSSSLNSISLNQIGNLKLLVILIVDDNAFNLFVLKRQLMAFSDQIQIFEAYNGQEAYNIAIQEINKINLIIMDCQMPILSGYDATKLIRNYEKLNLLKEIKIVGYTALLNENEIQQCKDAGMNDWLSKPSSQNQLFQMITLHLNLS